ncbi:DNA-binding protein [Niallia circulans]|uniref:DNA-binding protein n=1 Tax=Niallia circulans TaxID=1397 RepID=UPI0035184BA6
MEFHLKGRRDVEDFFATEILGSTETRELLDVNRQRLAQLKDSGRLKPIKSLAKENLFLRSEVLTLKKELQELRKQKGSKKI